MNLTILILFMVVLVLTSSTSTSSAFQPPPIRFTQLRGGAATQSTLKVVPPRDLSALLASEGAHRCKQPLTTLLKKSLLAGIFVGLGGILCTSTLGSTIMARHDAWHPSGVENFLFGAIGFPLSIIAVTLTGASAFTGNLALAGAAITNKSVTSRETARMLCTTYLGCFTGTTMCGLLTVLADLKGLEGCVGITSHKLALSGLQTFFRAIGGGFLIGLAITFGMSALKGGSSLADIAVGIWLPISSYVACDFEHCLANMFFFSSTIFSFKKENVNFASMAKNLLLSTAGNIAGAGGLIGLLTIQTMNLE
ncbi:hypothetical protein ScalyP_jg1460 [Parmales sp. scaly parma]|nr:hypothetical protein ScalyP_jg1460 [Parmales sp. scaly parma]